MIEKRVTVAHVAGGMTTGGVEQVVYDYVSHIDSDQYCWIYISYNPPSPYVQKKFQDLGFRIYTVTRKKEHFFRSCWEVYHILKKEQVQIVHSHMTVMCFITNVLGWMAGSRMRISHSHLVLYPTGWKRLIYEIFKWMDRITATHWVACSRAAGEYLFGKRNIEQHRVWIMPNALDYSRWRFNPQLRIQLRQRLGLGERRLLGHIGRFTEQKNHRFLLEVFEEYHRRFSDSCLVLVGDGPLMEETKMQAERRGLMESIIFSGSVLDPAPWYMAMDYFIFPSVYEGLGIAALEAQASGLPVLASLEVPREAALTDQIRFLALEEGAARWVDCLEEMPLGDRERDLKEILKKKNLDIESQAKKLNQFYQKGLECEGR